MNSTLIWDFPTRIFHWLFALCIVGALSIGLVVDDEEALFSVHMLCGLSAFFLVVVRLFWGIVGSRYAKLSTFFFSPKALVAYLRETLLGKATHFVGRNPGSAYATLGMLLLTLGLVISGLMSSRSEVFEEVHEIFAYLMLALIAAHLAGLAWATLRHRQKVLLEMITGRSTVDSVAGLSHAHPIAGLTLVVVFLLVIGGMWSGYDPKARNLRVPVFGARIDLNPENENEEHGIGEHGQNGAGAQEARHGEHNEEDND